MSGLGASRRVHCNQNLAQESCSRTAHEIVAPDDIWHAACGGHKRPPFLFDFTQRVTAMPRLHANSARFSARLLLAVAFLLGLASSAWSSSAPPSGANSEFPYVELSPSFVTNYDGGGRLRYLKVDVSVRTARPGDEVLRHHMPSVRSRLVELFSGQLEENLTSTEGKEKLRQDALTLIREAIDLVEGDGSENILDLFFTSYVIQQ